MTVDELRDMVQNYDDGKLVNCMTRSARCLRGTRSSWGQQKAELQTVVRNLGCHLFFSLPQWVLELV